MIDSQQPHLWHGATMPYVPSRTLRLFISILRQGQHGFAAPRAVVMPLLAEITSSLPGPRNSNPLPVWQMLCTDFADLIRKIACCVSQTALFYMLKPLATPEKE